MHASSLRSPLPHVSSSARAPPSSGAGSRAAAAELGQSDGELGEGRAAAAAAAHHQRPRHDPRHQVLQARAAARPRLAPIPRGDAALDRRHRHPRHAGAAGDVLSDPRHGADRKRAVGPHDRALQRVRALRALDDGDLLHHPGYHRAQHHLRQGAAAAADRAAGVLRLVAGGEVRAQLSELPVHARRRADLPDVDRRQYPDQGRHRMAQGRRRHRRPQPSAGLPLQCRPEADLLDRGARRRGHRRQRLYADVPVLRDRHRRHAERRWSTASSAMLFIAVMLAHIYIGTIGMEGAFEAMGTAPSTSIGRRSTTASGWRRKAPRPEPARRLRPKARCSRRNSAVSIAVSQRPASAPGV